VNERIEEIAPDWIHSMHGGTITGDSLHYFSKALREKEFAYVGMLLGREVDVPAAG
jgi:hypothetical protein